MLDINTPLSQIATLEDTHKCSLDPPTLVELSNARQDLLRLLAEPSPIARDKGCHIHYTQANKCGKHLARVLHPRQDHTMIDFILSPSRTKQYVNS